ncbi:hypothetical protein [Sphingomonas sp.]|uniref:hypothetical protein n=1 Tax=Sphingomonas sp. TaxID=28214 RepID=UPI000DB3CE76|nr:hypothetical protein [Sphingomonas sp.]PZU10050.1 MAG: hypothetical protein DI605_05465 [Sphingomonas sp.]
MSEQTIIERVAVALLAAVAPWADWETGSQEDREKWMTYARAAIAAMREPTVTMIASCGDLPCSQQEVWARSIDAALQP